MDGRMKATHSFLARLCRILALATASACAAAGLAGQIGRWSESLDVLNHFAPYWLALAVAAALLWLACGPKGRSTPILAGAAALIWVLVMAPETLEALRPSPPERGQPSFKVIQVNLWFRNEDPAATISWILAQKADVLVLEESSHPIINPLRKQYPYRVTCTGVPYCPTMILSKTPPLGFGGLTGPDGWTGSHVAWGAYAAQGGPVTVVGAHLRWPYPTGVQSRETDLVAGLLAKLPKDRMIVTGDFNSTPWSFSMQRQDRLFGLERRTHGLFTWPATDPHHFRIHSPIPLLPLDQVYAGAGWRAISIQRGPRIGSDHFPLAIDLWGAT
jgi:endonuclease/exonuclease/phosphatase (EEP) superfamily protein YafD